MSPAGNAVPPGEARDGLGAGLVLDERRQVEARRVAGRPGHVRDGDDLAAGLVQEPGRPHADVAEPLHGVGEVRDPGPRVREQALGGVHQPPPGGRLAAQRPAEFDRLAGDDARVVPVELGVLVENPGHDLGVGAHVRGGHVGVRADHVVNLLHEGPGQPLEFAGGKRLGVHGDAALGPAVGQVHHGRLPGHQRRERDDLVEVHLRVVADAALHRAAGVVVLDAEADVGGERPVVLDEAALDLDLAVRGDEEVPLVLVDLQQVGGAVEVHVRRFGGGHAGHQGSGERRGVSPPFRQGWGDATRVVVHGADRVAKRRADARRSPYDFSTGCPLAAQAVKPPSMLMTFV